jgi:hypothetical protein
VAFFNEVEKRPDLAELMSGFVSLGVNCELGLVQRHCACDQASLLRFGYIPPAGLIDAMNCQFEGIGDAAQLDLEILPRGEFQCTHTRFKFEIHTQMRAPEFTEERVRQRLVKHYGMLGRLLMEQLGDGEKIFVYRAPAKDSDPAEADRIGAAMSAYGNNILMWVACATDPALAGTVQWRVPGRVMIGYLDRFAPLRHAARASFDMWVKLCASAIALRAAQGIACAGIAHDPIAASVSLVSLP